MKHVFRLIFFFTFEFLSQFIADGLKIIKGVLGRSQRDDFVFSIALNFANLTYNNNKVKVQRADLTCHVIVSGSFCVI